MEPSADHRRRENHGAGGQAGLRDHRTRLVSLQIPIRGVVGFPNPVEVGFAGDARQTFLTGGGDWRGALRDQREKNRRHGSRR